MNKRPLTTTIVTHLLRGASFIALLFIGINMIRFAQAQPQNNKSSINSETSHNDVRSPVGTKTLVKVHDTAERTQIASPQQNYSAHQSWRSIGHYLWRGVPCGARPSRP